ncbi:MAG TPA: XdhC family protein [Verrucomicrobiae bacterium]|jgi:xanthine dehydrogenase accessory factor|nr:XdhC family protein [Verrucomicrobiae bacterium]
MKRALLDRLLAERAAKQPVALVTEFPGGAQALVTAGGVEGELTLDGTALAEIRPMLSRDKSGIVEVEGRRLFVQCHTPPPRLMIVGAVHIAQALAPMASLAGYGVTVIDPRRAFATDSRFPGIDMRGDWPDEAMTALAPDRRTAVVTLTHDPKLDDPALQTALRSPAFYIGALGSKKTHAARQGRLARAGFSPEEIARVNGPVGLSIGALSPAEIAVSILAQITAIRRQA